MNNAKFRLWNSIDKKWLLGYEYPNLGGFSMFGETMAFGGYSDVLNSYSIEDWDKLILMQSTTIFDKNGKEIYEGDIIKFGTNSNHIVKYEEYRKVDYGHGDCGEKLIIGFNIGSSYGKDNIPEIIGNIYENPELIQ